MIEFRIMYEQEGAAILECECCGYPAPLAKLRFTGPDFTDRFENVCKVCSSTFLNAVNRNTDTNTTQADRLIAKSIGYIANMILDEIWEKP